MHVHPTLRGGVHVVPGPERDVDQPGALALAAGKKRARDAAWG